MGPALGATWTWPSLGANSGNPLMPRGMRLTLPAAIASAINSASLFRAGAALSREARMRAIMPASPRARKARPRFSPRLAAGPVMQLRLLEGSAVRAAGAKVTLVDETVDSERTIGPVDRIVAATGQRPDLTLTRELRLELDPWLESVRALGPLIDPNVHSCGSAPPHGHRELAHPEPEFYTVGVKSYGR